MANLAYRSNATGNWSATATWQVYSISASGGTFASGGTWGTASDYPKTGDYVWIQSTNVVTYDATAISTNNSATFALISNNINSNSLAVAQPATGGTNATTGTISLSVASTTTINATYYNIASGTAGLFNFTSSNTTYNFTGTWYEGTTGSWMLAPSGSNNTINITGNIKSSGTSGTGINLTNLQTLNIIGTVTAQSGSVISCSGASSVVNITGDVYGSSTAQAYAITASSVAITITITGNLFSGVNATAIYTPAFSTLTITGNIRNYGSSGTSSFSAYVCQTVNIRSTATVQFRTSDAGVKDFVTTSIDPTLTAATIWAYATRRLTDATNITSNGSTISQTQLANLDATVSSRLATSGYTTPPTAQDISNQVLSDIDTNPSSLATITRLHNVSTVDTTGQQIQTI